jgi:hypothetical protein
MIAIIDVLELYWIVTEFLMKEQVIAMKERLVINLLICKNIHRVTQFLWLKK